jgi:hypothetical protein
LSYGAALMSSSCDTQSTTATAPFTAGFGEISRAAQLALVLPVAIIVRAVHSNRTQFMATGFALICSATSAIVKKSSYILREVNLTFMSRKKRDANNLLHAPCVSLETMQICLELFLMHWIVKKLFEVMLSRSLCIIP